MFAYVCFAICVCMFQLLSQGAFGYLLPIISFILAWIETWLLDFKVLPQEADDENSEYGKLSHCTPRVHPNNISFLLRCTSVHYFPQI